MGLCLRRLRLLLRASVASGLKQGDNAGCWRFENADLLIVGVTGAEAARCLEDVTDTAAHVEYWH